MSDISKFQELIGKTLEIAKLQNNRIDRQKVKEIFAGMDLTDVQFDQINAYLTANKIEVEGYEKPKNTAVATEVAEPSEDDSMEDAFKTEHKHTSKGINAKDTVYLEQYLDELKEIKGAAPGEEKQLLGRIKKGDITAKGRFTEINLNKVVEIANEYRNQGMTVEDLIQEGNMALIQSLDELPDIEDYDKLMEFIYSYVRNGITVSLVEQQESDDFEGKVMEESNRIFNALKKLEEELGRKASLQELAEYTKLSEEEIEDILEFTAEALEIEHGDDHHHEHHHEHHHDHN